MKALRTLVVEDDAMIGGLLAETLEGLGHAVCAVESDVANAVAAASHLRPDLMIVDVGLGEATGVAALKEILRSRFVPNVFVTGNAVRGAHWVPRLSSFKSPFACRIWSEQFNGRSQRRGHGTESRSKAKRMGGDMTHAALSPLIAASSPNSLRLESPKRETERGSGSFRVCPAQLSLPGKKSGARRPGR